MNKYDVLTVFRTIYEFAQQIPNQKLNWEMPSTASVYVQPERIA